jgi:GT2 family glycosyltransferase
LSSNWPHVTILILNYNGQPLLNDCIQSVLATEYPTFEVVLVDNASTDDSVSFIGQHFPSVRIIQFEKNYGFAEGYDRAIRQTDGNFIALLNNDTRVHPRWLIELMRPLQDEPSIAIAGAKLLCAAQPEMIDHAGGLISPIGSGIDRAKYQPDRHAQFPSGAVGFACGGALLLRKSCYLEVGGFDPDYQFYHEDVDLAWRCWLGGYEVYFVNTAIVYHKGGELLGGRESPMRIFLCQRNRLWNLAKNANAWNLVKGVIFSLLFDAYRAISSGFQGYPGGIAAIIKGNWAAGSAAGPIWRKRRAIQARRTISDRALRQRGVICTLAQAIQSYRELPKHARSINTPRKQE